ncbi:MAG: 1-phosphofructokinase family hexose kinase [Capsulimonadaceae bacterium]
MLRLVTVTLNPSLDVVYEVPGFQAGTLNRVKTKTVSAGGKGLNLARVYRALGGEAVAVLFAGGRIGADIRNAVAVEGLSACFVDTECESRLCVKVVDTNLEALTEINEPGGAVSEGELARLFACVRRLLADADTLIVAGSAPPGMPADTFARLIRLAQDESGVMGVLDASGQWLRDGIAAGPQLVKSNVHEAADLGVARTPWQDMAAAIRDRYAIPIAIVTAGARGAVLATPRSVWQASPPSIKVRSAVGSGDALLAGFLAGLSIEGGEGEALRTGVAAGAVNAQSYRSGVATEPSVLEMAGHVALSRLA